ncbi:MAG: hypothetical protein ACLPYW_10875 [Acidimicrobiales bacterium]
MAVGSYYEARGSLPLIETLAKGKSSAVEPPLPPDGASYREYNLTSVACGAVRSCVATGAYFDQSGDAEAVIETLSNGEWSATEAQLPSGALAHPGVEYGPSLSAVSCGATGSCSAVGWYYSSEDKQFGLVERRSGGKWSAAKAALPAGDTSPATLSSVSCREPSLCVAIGTAAAGGLNNESDETLSGKTLGASNLPLPSDLPAWEGALDSLSCATAHWCTAVGNFIATLSDGRWSAARSKRRFCPTPLPTTLVSWCMGLWHTDC